VTGPVTPEQPFEAPWQARAFALAVELAEHTDDRWDGFRARLSAAIADEPERPYWESWVVALEGMAASL
jgi:hypothetical protein